MLETIIERIEKDDFFHNTIETYLIEKYYLNDILYRKSKNRKQFFKKSHIYLFQIKEREYRRADSLFYSRIYSTRIMGILSKNLLPFSLVFKLNCAKCFYNIDSNEKTCLYCLTCNTKFQDVEYPYFINIREFLPQFLYEEIKDYYNLGEEEEFMRDQRTKICNPIKYEIIEKALHPDKIKHILQLTNNDFFNIYNYI